MEHRANVSIVSALFSTHIHKACTTFRH
jgi:hypothetical protein